MLSKKCLFFFYDTEIMLAKDLLGSSKNEQFFTVFLYPSAIHILFQQHSKS